jgi:hypothetical protein
VHWNDRHIKTLSPDFYKIQTTTETGAFFTHSLPEILVTFAGSTRTRWGHLRQSRALGGVHWFSAHWGLCLYCRCRSDEIGLDGSGDDRQTAAQCLWLPSKQQS